jgi:hypothetical protein
MRKVVIYLLLGLLGLSLNAAQAQGQAKKAKQKSSAGRGATAPKPPPPPNPENDAAFRKHDMNGDGLVSKAEAAGHYDLMMGFDKSDRNRDGKLSRAEYDRYTARAAQAKTRTAASK